MISVFVRSSRNSGRCMSRCVCMLVPVMGLSALQSGLLRRRGGLCVCVCGGAPEMSQGSDAPSRSSEQDLQFHQHHLTLKHHPCSYWLIISISINDYTVYGLFLWRLYDHSPWKRIILQNRCGGKWADLKQMSWRETRYQHHHHHPRAEPFWAGDPIRRRPADDV